MTRASDEPTERDAGARQSRAERCIEAASRWLLNAPIGQLLETLSPGDVSDGIRDDPGLQDWLHLNEDLPAWVDNIIATRSVDHRSSLTEDHVELLRQALRIEKRAAVLFNSRLQDGIYLERSQAPSGSFGPEVRQQILQSCAQLGLVEATRPPKTTYDKTLIMGGGYRSPLLRARYAAQLGRAGVDLGDVYFLGSPRFLQTDEARPEAAEVADYAPGAKDEYDLMVAAAESQFGFKVLPTLLLCGCSRVDEICARWPLSHHANANGTPPEYTHERSAVLLQGNTRAGAVLSARTSRPPLRPDTADTLVLLARYSPSVAGQRALIVTTQVFVPFQRFDAMRRLYLDHGIKVDTVGFGADWGDRPLTAAYMLQETLSGIRSARRLLVASMESLYASDASSLR